MKSNFLLLLLFSFFVFSIQTSCTPKKKKETPEQIKARLDSMQRANEQQNALAQAEMEEAQVEEVPEVPEVTEVPQARPQYSGYYVVIGSFLEQGNADDFLAAMQEMFEDENFSSYNQGRWNYIVIGGKLGSMAEASKVKRHASRILSDVNYDELGSGEMAMLELGYDSRMPMGGGFAQEEEEEYEEEQGDEYADEEESSQEQGGDFYSPWILPVR